MLILNKCAGYGRDGRRVHPKGGGDPGADARNMEAERQGRITAATDQINAVFNGAQNVTKTRAVKGAQLVAPIASGMQNFGHGDQEDLRYIEGAAGSYAPDTTETYTELEAPAVNPRDNLYKEQRSAVYDINKMEVDRQAQEAARANKFGLARSGLAGGSVDVDSNNDINRRTNEGLLRAGGIADQSAADLKTSDERTRSNLISMAQSGIDTGSAATMALNGLKVNADSVASQRAGASVGGLFSDMSQAYLVNQANAGRTAANGAGSQWFGVSTPSQKYSGT